MAERERFSAKLGEVERRLSSWRRLHGGRGRPIPEELWAAATDVACVAGVGRTARVLGMDCARLARRVGERPGQGAVVARTRRQPVPPSPAFVRVDAQRVFTRSKAVVRLTSPGGEQLEVEVEGSALEVAAVARALWERSP